MCVCVCICIARRILVGIFTTFIAVATFLLQPKIPENVLACVLAHNEQNYELKYNATMKHYYPEVICVLKRRNSQNFLFIFVQCRSQQKSIAFIVPNKMLCHFSVLRTYYQGLFLFVSKSFLTYRFQICLANIRWKKINTSYDGLCFVSTWVHSSQSSGRKFPN